MFVDWSLLCLTYAVYFVAKFKLNKTYYMNHVHSRYTTSECYFCIVISLKPTKLLEFIGKKK